MISLRFRNNFLNNFCAFDFGRTVFNASHILSSSVIVMRYSFLIIKKRRRQWSVV